MLPIPRPIPDPHVRRLNIPKAHESRLKTTDFGFLPEQLSGRHPNQPSFPTLRILQPLGNRVSESKGHHPPPTDEFAGNIKGLRMVDSGDWNVTMVVC